MLELIIDDTNPREQILVEVEDGTGKSLSVEQYGKEYRHDGYRVISIDGVGTKQLSRGKLIDLLNKYGLNTCHTLRELEILADAILEARGKGKVGVEAIKPIIECLELIDRKKEDKTLPHDAHRYMLETACRQAISNLEEKE